MATFVNLLVLAGAIFLVLFIGKVDFFDTCLGGLFAKFGLYERKGQKVSDDLVVQLDYPRGKIKGHILKSERGLDFYAFQEIPYAAPPTGDLRFKIPRRHAGWDGILDTTANTRVCMQPLETNLPLSEDCLHLNVYTPVKPGTNKKLAVYVWIHGGGFIVWDSDIARYGPHYLIDYDIVVVSLTYRLGAFGFLSTDDGIIPGNLGLRDQNMALQWVQENIHLFGGDPDKVTIGGESAGSASVSFHILSDLSRGLFRGAVVESGSAINYFAYVPSPSVYAFQLGKILDSSVNSEDSTRLLEVLRKADADDILKASLQVHPVEAGVLMQKDLVWAPTVERIYTVTPFISKLMHEAYINGDFARVPILIGHTSEEMAWWLPTSKATPAFKLNEKQLKEKLAYVDAHPDKWLNHEINLDGDKARIGKLVKRLYTNKTFTEDLHAYLKYSSDLFLSHGTVRQAETSSKYVPVYLYQFDYTGERRSEYPGTQHTDELLYLWKNVEEQDVTEFQPILRDRMCKLWTNFVKYLNPTPQQDKALEHMVWPKVTPENLVYVNINEHFEVRTNPRLYCEVRDIVLKHIKAPLIVY